MVLPLARVRKRSSKVLESILDNCDRIVDGDGIWRVGAQSRDADEADEAVEIMDDITKHQVRAIAW